MRRSIFALRALATLTLTSASALPQHAARGILADQTFSCSGGQSLSLCCASRVPSNGAAEDCQESLHFMIGPTRLSPNDLTRQIDSAAVNQCSSEQLKKGFNRPVCCKAGFRPAVSTSDLRHLERALIFQAGWRSGLQWHQLCGRKGRRRLEMELRAQKSLIQQTKVLW